MAAPMLTPEVQCAVCAALTDGLSLREAALVVGVTPKQARTWFTRGARDGPPYSDFRDAVVRARLAWRRAQLLAIQGAAPNNWRAGAWLLERLGGKRYRPRKQQQTQAAQQLTNVHVDLRPYAELIQSIDPADVPPQPIPAIEVKSGEQGCSPARRTVSRTVRRGGPRAAGG